jgi:peptide/nickel transport system substrate-binding protein
MNGSPSVALRVGLSQEIDHLNPFIAVKEAGTMVGRLAWEFLTVPSATDLSPVPGLAESWECAPDGLTWTYRLRPGLAWSDGRPVTASDAVFTFRRIMSDPVAAEANGNFVASFADVVAEDERTLVIRTSTPQASMNALDVPIVPEHVWSGITDMSDPATDDIELVKVGSGPFLVAEHRPGELLRMRVNPGYWRGAAPTSEIHFVMFRTCDEAIQALQAGEIDIVNRLTAAEYESLRNVPGISAVHAESRRYSHLLLNPGAKARNGRPIGDGHPALRDVRVRRAIAKAIDLRAVLNEIFGGYGHLGGGIIPPIFTRYHWSPGPGERHDYDLAAADAELDVAGYSRDADGTRVDRDGQPLRFRLIWRATTDYHKVAARRIVSWLARIGIHIADEGLPDPELERRTTSGRYDMVVAGWASGPDPDAVLSKQTSNLLPITEGSTTSASFFSDAEFDELYAQQLAELDLNRRATLVRRAQARYYDQVPSIVLCYPAALEAYRSDRFGAFTRQPVDNGPIMEQSGYWGFYTAEYRGHG